MQQAGEIGNLLYIHVSILTRPEGRVQRRSGANLTASSRFQSSPVPKDGCNCAMVHLFNLAPRFQSSPVPKDGCNAKPNGQPLPSKLVSILTRPEGRVQLAGRQVSVALSGVSILTRPEGRVQRQFLSSDNEWQLVSILTRPEGRVQLANPIIGRILAVVSILTRPEGRVQRGKPCLKYR